MSKNNVDEGLKAELVARLLEAMNKEQSVPSSIDDVVNDENEPPSNIPEKKTRGRKPKATKVVAKEESDEEQEEEEVSDCYIL
jgi:hypothetical protein